MTAPKKQADEITKPKHSLWQPPERRGVVSDEGKKWLEENAEAIRQWNDWADQNDLPLAKYRSF